MRCFLIANANSETHHVAFDRHAESFANAAKLLALTLHAVGVLFNFFEEQFSVQLLGVKQASADVDPRYWITLLLRTRAQDAAVVKIGYVDKPAKIIYVGGIQPVKVSVLVNLVAGNRRSLSFDFDANVLFR